MLDLRCHTRPFSSCGGRETLPCRAPPALGTQAQWSWHMGLGAPGHVGSSQTRDQTHVLSIGRQILMHWTTREIQYFFSLFLTLLCQKAKVNSAESKRMTWNLLYYYSVRCSAFSPRSSTKMWLSWLLIWGCMIHISLNSGILFQVLK